MFIFDLSHNFPLHQRRLTEMRGGGEERVDGNFSHNLFYRNFAPDCALGTSHDRWLASDHIRLDANRPMNQRGGDLMRENQRKATTGTRTRSNKQNSLYLEFAVRQFTLNTEIIRLRNLNLNHN